MRATYNVRSRGRGGFRAHITAHGTQPFNNASSNGKTEQSKKRSYDAFDGSYMVSYNINPIVSLNADRGNLSQFENLDGTSAALLDSGTTNHAFKDRCYFIDMEPFKIRSTVTVAGMHQLEVHGVGTIAMLVDRYGTPARIAIKKVLFVPNMGINLLSTTQFNELGLEVTFTSDGRGVVYEADGSVVLTTTKKFRQNFVDYACVVKHKDLSDKNTRNLEKALFGAYATNQDDVPQLTTPLGTLIHQRMAHAPLPKLRLMGIQIDSYGACIPCIKAKSTRQRSTEPQPRREVAYEKIHLDTCGPIDPAAVFTGNLYFNIIVDDFSRFQTYVGIALKSQVFPKTVAFIKLLSEDGHKVKDCHSDHGGEFKSNDWKAYCKKAGINMTYSSVGTPEQNGISERSFRTAVEACRASLYTCGLPPQFWELAMQYCIYQLNRLPRPSLDNKSPYEILYGETPVTAHLRVFGCNAYARITTHLKKLAERTRTCVFVGIQSNNAYMLYDHERNHIFQARDVRFIEDDFSEAKKVFHDYEDIEDNDDPRDLDYVPDSFFQILEIEDFSAHAVQGTVLLTSIKQTKLTSQIEVPKDHMSTETGEQPKANKPGNNISSSQT